MYVSPVLPSLRRMFSRVVPNGEWFRLIKLQDDSRVGCILTPIVTWDFINIRRHPFDQSIYYSPNVI